MDSEVDLEEQRRALQAFQLAWEKSQSTLGVCVYSWVEHTENPRLGLWDPEQTRGGLYAVVVRRLEGQKSRY